MRYSHKHGLTIVELVVAISIAAAIILMISPLLINLISGFNRQSIEARNVQDVTTALSTINIDGQRNYKFLHTPDVDFTLIDDPTPLPEQSWSYTGGGTSDRILMLRLPATTRAYQDPGRELVYNSNTTNCSTFTGDPVTYTAIYYVEDSKLYKRTLLDPGQPTCTAPHQVTTCMSSCARKDILLAENVTSFSVDYYAEQNSNTPVSYTTLEEAGLDTIPSAKVTIEVSRPGPNDTTLTYRNSVRINVYPDLRVRSEDV